MWILASTAASAVTLAVPGQYPTIADAVSAASDGDVIEIAAGAYHEHVIVSGLDLAFVGEPGVTWTSPAMAEVLECVDYAVCTVVGIRFDGQGQRRGIDVGTYATLVVEDATFVGGWASNDGGAIRARDAVSVTIRRSVFDGNATAGSGAAVYATRTPLVEVSSSTMTGGSAGVDAGAIRVTNGIDVVLTDLWIEGNGAYDDGGGVDVDATPLFTLTGSMLCGNVAGDEGGGVVVRDAEATVRGNVMVANEARAGGGLMGAGGAVESVNNHFVANEAFDNGSGVYATGDLASRNDLFVHQQSTPALDAGYGDLDYGGFWSNGAGNENTPGSPDVTSDPLLGGVPPFACDPVPLIPQPGSPLIDAGDPAILDLDGSRSDIGAFGGADPFPADVPDDDGDGFDLLSDCDDADPDRYPGAPERCNGVDDDCDAVLPPEELEDADVDGWAVCADCDDDAPDVHPGRPEIPCNAVDDDCDLATDDGATAEVVGDSIDQDCDGGELCYPDADGDGRGEAGMVESADIDCADPGEAAAPDDACLGFDDAVDPDGDGVATGCDPCPADPADDSDGDEVCDGDDRCPGGDDRVDTDGDGTPDACEGTDPPQGGGDADGDGAVDLVDPFPHTAGGGAGIPPRARLGCGCVAAGGGGSGPSLAAALAALAVVTGRRPRRGRRAP